jgi:SAM-dependent methyltransferase
MKTLYFQSITKTYNKLSIWGKILLFLVAFLMVVSFMRPLTHPMISAEGFIDHDKFLFKTGTDVYDDFYSEIYDQLVYSSVKNSYEIGAIVNRTGPTEESIILDVGCGTGHHVAELAAKNLKVTGVDLSEEMIAKAKSMYPNYDFRQADALNATVFRPNSYTHILCLYFTIYYMKDKVKFFKNCMTWLKPGGYLVVHLVDRDLFDPILPPGNPLMMVSPQRYAKERITKTKVTFNNFLYDANFDLDDKTGVANFVEKFKFKDAPGKVRKNEHQMSMPPLDAIVQMAEEQGFILQGVVDLVEATYEYQYLYMFVKPR